MGMHCGSSYLEGNWRLDLPLGLLDDKHFYHRVSAKHILDS